MSTLYAGIDLHSTNSMVVVTDDKDAVVYEKRLRNDLDTLLKALAPFQEALQGVVVESTYNWYWLVDGLMDQGLRVHLANTTAIQQYSGLKHTGDASDARWLAQLLRLNILPEGYIYPKEERAVRDLLRKRSQLVRQRTAHLLSVKNLVTRNTGRTLSAAGVARLSNAEVPALFEYPEQAQAVQASLSVLRCLSQEIETLEKLALARCRLREAYRVLLSVSGIGPILALTIMLETGPIGRFPSVGNYASYARCVASEHVSNGKKKGEGNTRNGNAYLAWAFSEAAVFAVRYDETIQRYYQRKCARSKHVMVARKAVAHKLARACYHLLKTQTPFDVHRAFV